MKIREVSFTSANCIDILQATHHLMSDKITVVPDSEMWLPQKLSKRLPPLVGSTDSSICVFFVINFWGDVWSSKIEYILSWNSSCIVFQKNISLYCWVQIRRSSIKHRHKKLKYVSTGCMSRSRPFFLSGSLKISTMSWSCHKFTSMVGLTFHACKTHHNGKIKKWNRQVNTSIRI